jgi:hypothetical protein
MIYIKIIIMQTPIVLVIIIILFLIVMLVSYKYGRCNAESEMLRGFYESNKEFTDEAGISSFTFYIGDCINGKYKVYRLMIGNDDEKILINSPTEMSLATIWNYCDDHYEYTASFTDLNSEFIPNNVLLKHYIRSGKIILSDESDTIYGCLFKNPVLTELDLIKEEKSHMNSLPNKTQPHDDVDEIEDID